MIRKHSTPLQILLKLNQYLMLHWKCSLRFAFFFFKLYFPLFYRFCFGFSHGESCTNCLVQDENRRVEEREWLGEKYLIHFFDYETEKKKFLIWGLTAGILIRAASVVYQKPPAFMEQNPKFRFPRDVNSNTVMR